MAEVAGLFPRGWLVIQPATAHFPWLDDAETFMATVAGVPREGAARDEVGDRA